MPTQSTARRTTTAPTREQVEQQAAEIAAQLDEYRRQDVERDQAAQARRDAAQQEWDKQFVAGFSRAALEAEVTAARAALDQALAENPLTIALADYLTALRRRSHVLLEQSSALGRLGLPTAAPQSMETELRNLDDLLLPVASRIASERVAAELAELHARRESAGTD